MDDAKAAFEASVAHGGVPVLPPTTLTDEASGTTQTISEVKLYGDVVLRYALPVLAFPACRQVSQRAHLHYLGGGFVALRMNEGSGELRCSADMQPPPSPLAD